MNEDTNNILDEIEETEAVETTETTEVANYEKVDRFIRFDAALTPAGKRTERSEKWRRETKRRRK